MRLTEMLKNWLVKEQGVKSDASDEEFAKAAGEAFASGALTPEAYKEMTKDADGDVASALTGRMDQIADGLAKLTEVLTKSAQANTESETPAESKETEKAAEPKAEKQPEWQKKMAGLMTGTTFTVDDGEVRVKGAWEAYDTTKSVARFPETTKDGGRHPFAGQPLKYEDHIIDDPSDRDKAVAGAFAKFMVHRAMGGGLKGPALAKLSQHERELLFYGMDTMKWSGATDAGSENDDIKGRPLSRDEQKALIDDATSGGLEAAPIVFDDMVIQTPLLHGELFPLVNVVTLDRGRRIEGVITGTVTGSWGGVDDSAISLFTTTSYVSAFDNTVYRWEGAFRIGLDFLSDTPIDFASHVSAQYGERLLEDLDDVIAVGNGTTQPEGVMNKSGTTSVAFSGTSSIGSIESLRYSVAKAEHRSNVAASAVYCGTETTYQRWRALAVGASDNRRLFGMDHFGPNGGGYRIDGGRFAVNESMANTQAFYCIMKRYRMYRRRGLTMRTSTEGDTLIRNNELLLVAMSRWAGALERGAVAAVSTTLGA